ncbi:LOB domain-containing protein 21-like [Andrographis paniculata]|uniref:LOB domain-containing protein 21-like n=1 Tax=Andrographis paniculata TaxID=175694 RepID=UPI0021E8F146|nr:LOB domain-containing protein 21-like [Andrographis paniculata]
MKKQEGRSCAACKFLKRRCIRGECVFAPYFGADEPNKFAKVHKVFGASNVTKILTDVPHDRRQDAVNSLVYEADLRLHDPVYGCIGAIASLHHTMLHLQNDLLLAQARLAAARPPPPPPLPLPDPSDIDHASAAFFDSIDHDHRLGELDAAVAPPPPPPYMDVAEFDLAFDQFSPLRFP